MSIKSEHKKTTRQTKQPGEEAYQYFAWNWQGS